MPDHSIEHYALKQLWATLRHSLAPELTSPLAKDRAKRADAAMLRLVAGYEQLPTLRAMYASRYSALLTEARELAGETAIQPQTPAGESTSGLDNPVFVGIPGVAGELESLLKSLSESETLSSQPRSGFDRLLREVVHVEATCRADYESRVASVVPKVGSDASRALTVETMQHYLSGHSQGSGAVVRSVHEIPGGRSKRTVLVSLDPSGSLPTELVLRLDTGRGTGTAVTDEHPLLARLAKLGLPVPDPLWLESSNEPFGFPCIVFSRTPGSAAGDLMEGAFRKEPATARALARALAQVHAAGERLIEDPGRRGSAVPHTRDLLSHYLDYWRSKKPFPSLVIEAAFIWLFRRINDGLGDATVVHADTGFHNLLLDDSGSACLLDWEFAHFGDPAEDLASCRPAVERCMPWTDFLAEYRAHGGKEVSDFRLRYFEIWRPLRNAVVCGTVMHTLMNGGADDVDPVTISLSTFMRLQADLARSLEGVLSGPG
jgi:aminoglycoside phosphotransferase (APT) family kinase protein